jgi:murein DD-endopeptidase MepM/ murein hydrolase activator NlpD
MWQKNETRTGPRRSDRFVLEWSLGGLRKRIELSPLALGLLAAAALASGLAAPCAAAYLAFRDDVLAELVERQTQMRYAYEDRLAALRLRLDQVTSRQMIDQDSVEGRLESLIVRQAKLETRGAVVARLVEGVTTKEGLAVARRGGPPPFPPTAAARSALPPGVSAYLPASEPERPAAFAAPDKPKPEGMDLRLGHDDDAPSERSVGGPDGSAYRLVAPLDETAYSEDSIQTRLQRVSLSLDRIEREQTTRVASLVEPMRRAAGRLRRAFDAAGLPIERYVPRAPAVGGPYASASDPGDLAFERELSAAQSAAATLDGLRRALPTVPLRKPLAGELETTSTFGYRTDPFLGRPALHTGVDLREDHGAPARATAAGVVVTAGPSGGYGNMVEIDHGGGLATRYAHLSSISTAVGEHVAAGAVVGRVGSTGRSTGPHLHYEVRVDGEPVDPARFLRAAATLAESR